MEKKRSNIIRTVLSLGVAAVLLWLSFRGVGWDDFAAGLRACRWEFVALSMLAAVVPFIARGVRWRMLIEPFAPSIKACVFMGLMIVAFLAILWNRYGEFFLSRVLGPASSKLGLVWILLGLVAVLAVFLWLLWR